MQPKDVYSQPELADPILDEGTVLALARETLPSASKVTAVDESGGEARAYMIDDGYVLKTQRPHRVRARTSLKKEVVFLLNVAALAPDLNVPRVLGFGGHRGEVEYILMTRMRGQAFARFAPQGDARRRALTGLGRALHRLHTLPLTPFEQTGLFPGDTSTADLTERLEAPFRAAAPILVADAGVRALAIDVERLTETVLKATADFDSTRAALHSNPGPPHAFIEAGTSEFCGLIDFGDAYVSHPAFDLRPWRAAPDREALLEGYTSESPVSDGFLRTLRLQQTGDLMAALAGLGRAPLTPLQRDVALQDLGSLAALV